ncbi:MAG: hypothetical protein QXK84_07235 [Nitrososphaerota archaeon]
MSKITILASLLIPLGLLLLLLGFLFRNYILKIMSYAVLFTAGLLISIFILVPLLILAVGLAYRGELRRIIKKNWEESKYMLISLGLQAVTAYLSILIHAFMNVDFWVLMGLFILNSFLLINLGGESYNYTATSDNDAGIAVVILGCLIYGVYIVTLIEKL